MAILDIITHPNELLTQPCEEVKEVTEEIKTLIDDMLDTMTHNNALGIAAPQVGVLKQIFIINVPDVTEGPIVFINPVLNQVSKTKTKFNEGCLSFPGLFVDIERLTQVGVEALDREGEKFDLIFSGIPAFCVQHELDHLRGKLFTENLSMLKKRRAIKKYDKLQNANTLEKV